jgi:hypothetical protein
VSGNIKIDYRCASIAKDVVPKWMLALVGAPASSAEDCRRLADGETMTVESLVRAGAYASVFWFLASCISVLAALAALIGGWAVQAGGTAGGTLANAIAYVCLAAFICAVTCYGTASLRANALGNAIRYSSGKKLTIGAAPSRAIPKARDGWIALALALAFLAGGVVILR